jgi:hypothetical protein
MLLHQAGLLARHTLRAARTPLAAIRPRLVARRFHAFGVGCPKTGTHSLVGLLGRYRAAHEPENELLIPHILRGTPRTAAARAALMRGHDRRLWLELESSHLLIHFLDTLVAEWPDARFVLTTRDCYSWLDSVQNWRRRRPVPSRWRELARFRWDVFVPAHVPDVPRDADGTPRRLDAALAYWALHQQLVLDTVPADRLLILRTHELAGSGDPLGRFLGIPARTLDTSQAHLFKTAAREETLGTIDRDTLDAAVERHCGPLMRRLFPEIRGLDDARRRWSAAR